MLLLLLQYERVAQIHSEKNYDCYINLCDGLVEDDNPEPEGAGVEVAKALESLNLPFTGTSPLMALY